MSENETAGMARVIRDDGLAYYIQDVIVGKEPFYERYGFTARPNENFGSGMTIFWKGSTNTYPEMKR